MILILQGKWEMKESCAGVAGSCRQGYEQAAEPPLPSALFPLG